MRFLLSIHDIWPGNFNLVAGYLARIRSLGPKRIALLVVPRYHDLTPMAQSLEFMAWLREEAAGGAEIFLHGFRHLMPEVAEGKAFQGRRSAWGIWINRQLVGQEAEFSGLSEPDKIRLLEMGTTAFRQSGIDCAGFVAPTWHGAPPHSALRAQGIHLLETRFFIHDLASNLRRFAPPLAWRQAPGQEPVLFGGAVWMKTLMQMPLIKMAIHPGDLDGKDSLRILETVFAKGVDSAYSQLFHS